MLARTKCRGLGRRVDFAILACLLVSLGNRDGHAQERAQPDRPARKLIEFGWDEPDTAFMRHHAGEMERAPFDGCVFHVLSAEPQGRHENFTWHCWGSRAFAEAELQPALDDLKATTFRRFRHNFLRFNASPGDLDWFDDHAAVLANARLAAKVAREGRCAGILFDVEEYRGGLFTYAKQRDAKTKSWDEYAAKARQRGREVMAAFQGGYPDLTVFLTFGHSLPRTTSRGARNRSPNRATGCWRPSSTAWWRRRRARRGSWTASSFRMATRNKPSSIRAIA